MTAPPYKRFISFEGIDFSGKSTQVSLLLRRLESHHVPVHLLREPGGTVISEQVREILLSPEHREMHARTEILLYSAARAQLVHQEFLPLLESGRYLIADRFYDSTTAYQGAGRRLDPDFVTRLNEFATSGLTPHKTLFIDISPEEALKRSKASVRKQDRLEGEDGAFHETIRRAYLELANQNAERFIIIDGSPPVEEVAEAIWHCVCSIWDLGEFLSRPPKKK